jgi:hypothetical protein
VRGSVVVTFLVACGSSAKTVCPPPPPVAAPAPTPPSAASPPSGVDYGVSAQVNLDRGQAALAKHDPVAAAAYFAFVIARFPLSRLRHDAELGAIDAEAAAEGGELQPDAYCAFIEHHPFQPRVVSGEVACRIYKLKGKECAPSDAFARKYCDRPSYCTAAEAAQRPECQP